MLRCAISGRLQLREPKWIQMMSSMMTTTMMTTPTTTMMMMMLVVVMMTMLTAVVVTMIMLMHIYIHVRTHARTYPYNFGSMFLPPDHGVVLPPRYRWARAARRAMGGIRTFRIILSVEEDLVLRHDTVLPGHAPGRLYAGTFRSSPLLIATRGRTIKGSIMGRTIQVSEPFGRGRGGAQLGGRSPTNNYKGVVRAHTDVCIHMGVCM